MKITPRAVTLTSETAGKTYDGTALEKPVVTVGGDGFVEGQVTEIKATGSVTNAGSVANTMAYRAKQGNLQGRQLRHYQDRRHPDHRQAQRADHLAVRD